MKRTMDGHFHQAREDEDAMPTATVEHDPDSAADTVLVHRRHADPATLAVAGMAARTTRLGADPVARVTELYEQGARHITLTEPVDLSSAADAGRAARALVALREMTARTIAVDWQLRLGGPTDAHGDGREDMVHAAAPDAADGQDADLDPAVNLIIHLNPPELISGVRNAAAMLAAWRSGYFFHACIHRRAPGFIQVRDRRYGQLSRITIDEPDYLAVINAIQSPAPAAGLPEGIVADLEAENLVGRIGGLVWWVPYRVRRWPMPAMAL
jgi:hypothetical protein